jgi:hypothetical protein
VTARHIYIDETKQRGYLLVDSLHMATDVDRLRRAMRGLVLPGQTRIHMAKEGNSRRREIADIICNSGVSSTIYDAGRRYGSDQLAARAACLRAVVSDTTLGEQTLLVLEQDDSLIRWDRRFLYRTVRATGRSDTVRYEHRRAKSEPALTIPGCWARGGLWRQRIRPVVTTVIDV